jgi:hypothetical protein
MLATDFMKRRHLFDIGYPVCTPTRVTGTQGLGSLATERERIDLVASWQRYSTFFCHAHTIGNPALGEENARREPRHGRGCQEPNPR